MAKMLVSDEYRQYRKNLAEFEQHINPKPSEAERKAMKQAYLEKREVHETPVTPAK
jgi:hypothetical protein